MKDRLKLIRKTLKLNQTEFAKQIGLTQTSLSMIESGNSALTEKHIKLICVIFDVSKSWLRTGFGEMFSLKIMGENELLEIFRSLLPVTREALLNVGRQLMKTQEKLLAGVDSEAAILESAQDDEPDFPLVPRYPVPAPAPDSAPASAGIEEDEAAG
jgi:transcriptional regulator with XRE-family HTH domain